MVGETLTFALGMVFVVRPIMKRWIRWTISRGGEFGLGSLAILLAVLFGCSVLTGDDRDLRRLWRLYARRGALRRARISGGGVDETPGRRDPDFCCQFFFTSTGLRTDIGSLGSWTMAMWAALVLPPRFSASWADAPCRAQLSGFSFRESACIGAMMNTRGLMELVVVNLGYELRVIPPSVYCMLVLMALGTTLMTTPLLRRWAAGTELEVPIRESASRPAAVGGRTRAPP